MSEKYSRRLRQIARRKEIPDEAWEAYEAMSVHASWASCGELKAMYKRMAAVAIETFAIGCEEESGRQCALSRKLLTPNS